MSDKYISRFFSTFYKINEQDKAYIINSIKEFEDYLDRLEEKSKNNNNYDDEVFKECEEIAVNNFEDLEANTYYTKNYHNSDEIIEELKREKKNFILTIGVIAVVVTSIIAVTCFYNFPVQVDKKDDYDNTDNMAALEYEDDIVTNNSSEVLTNVSSHSLDNERTMYSSTINASSKNSMNSSETSNSEKSSNSSPASKTEDERIQDAKELIPYYNTRYFIKQLTGEDLENFCAIYQACINHEYECKLPYSCSQATCDDLIFLVTYECPEIVYDVYSDYGYNPSLNTVWLYDFQKDLDYETMVYDADEKLTAICNNVMSKSDYEKELYIYEYLLENCVCDKQTDNGNSPYGVLVEGKATSAGISRTFKWAMDKLGITSFSIKGENVDNWFVWNVVQLDGVYYDLSAKTSPESTTVEYKHFNVPREYYYNRYPELNYGQRNVTAEFKLPETSSLRGSYYYHTGAFVEEGQSAVDKLYEMLNDIYQQGGGTLEFQIENSGSYDDIKTNFPSYFNQWARSINSPYEAASLDCDDELHILSVTI